MMPASLLVIIIPIAAALPAFLMRRWRILETLFAVIACGAVIFLLAHPAGSPLRVAGFTIQTDAPINILGRELAVRSSDRMPLLLLYVMGAILFVMGARISQGWAFVPVGLGILTALSVALLIRPFVYAALAFEAAAAMGAVLIQSERNGKGSATGALRYLIITTLALPAFLGAGYVVGQAGDIPDAALQAETLAPAVTLLCVALGLVFGAFPLFTWTHPVAKDAPPLATALIATVGTSATGFLFLTFAQDFAWFRDNAQISGIMTLLGLLTLVTGGVLGWAQRSFGRVLACGIMVETGSMLLLLSHLSQLTVETLAFGALARVVSLGLLGLGMALLRERLGSDDFAHIAGHGRQNMWTALAIGIGGMSLAGLPGTVGFVSRWTTARAIGLQDLEALVLILLAGASVGVGVVRGMIALFASAPVSVTNDGSADSKPTRPLLRGTALIVVLAVILVITLGIAPGITEPLTRSIAQNYTFYK